MWGPRRPASQVVRQLELLPQGRPHVLPDMVPGKEHLPPPAATMGPHPIGHSRGLHPLPGARAATNLHSVSCPALAQSRRDFIPSPATPSREQTPLQTRGSVAWPRERDPVPDHPPHSWFSSAASKACHPRPPGPRKWMGTEAAAPSTPGHKDGDMLGHAWSLLTWTPGGGKEGPPRNPWRRETGPEGPGVPQDFRHLCSRLRDCGPHVCSRGGRLIRTS